MSATGKKIQNKKNTITFDPERSAVSQLDTPDFLRVFIGHFGLRRALELMGMAVLWDMLGLVPDSEGFKMAELVRRLEEGGFSSKSATYKAASDLKEFVAYFESLRRAEGEGDPFTVGELITMLLAARMEQRKYSDDSSSMEESGLQST